VHKLRFLNFLTFSRGKERKSGYRKMLSDNKSREPMAMWYVLLGAAIATSLAVFYFSITTEQKKTFHDLGMRNEAPIPPNCVCLNETKNAPTNNTEVLYFISSLLHYPLIKFYFLLGRYVPNCYYVCGISYQQLF
jgi:hypothetical protein